MHLLQQQQQQQQHAKLLFHTNPQTYNTVNPLI